MKINAELYKKYKDILEKPLKDFEDKDWKRQDKFFKELYANTEGENDE